MRHSAVALAMSALLAGCTASGGAPAPSNTATAVPVLEPTPTTPGGGGKPTTGADVAMPRAPDSAHHARVVHVTDGDTIVLDGIAYGEQHAATGGRKARLIGIDTPEVFGGVECYGRRASAFTREALGDRTVLIDFDVGKIDRYGRALVYVWEPNGAFFNGRLAREGFALQMTVPPNVRYAELFSDLVREAREARRGLWSGCPTDAL